jgi:hypothetical protein
MDVAMDVASEMSVEGIPVLKAELAPCSIDGEDMN